MRPKIAFLVATLALAALSAPAAVSAQPSSTDSLRAKVTALEAKVAKLDSMFGTRFLARAPQPTDLVPANVLGASGRYPFILSDYQIRLAIDDLYEKHEAVMVRLERIQYPSQTEPGPAPAPVGNFVNGDLVVTGRLCLGGPCKPGTVGGIHLSTPGSAQIVAFTNTAGLDGQGSATHASAITFGQDGGARLEHNYWYQNGAGVWQEGAKPRSILAFDSQGTLSVSQDYDGVIDRSQVVVLRIDRQRNLFAWTGMKPGMKHCLGWSTQVNDFVNLWCPELGNASAPAAPSLGEIMVRRLTFVNDQGPVVSFSLGTNNDKPIGSRQGRLLVNWTGDYSAEIEVEPGPACCDPARGNAIISQLMQWGQRTADGTGRSRLTQTIAVDGDGGQYGLIDATTNDPSMSAGQSRSMPLVFNAGEGRGMYLTLFPSDNTVEWQDRLRSFTTGRQILKLPPIQ